MKDPNLHITEIERYLNGEMAIDEKTAFEQKLKEDKDLMEVWNNVQTMKAGIKTSVLVEKMAFLREIEERDFNDDYTDEIKSTTLHKGRKKSGNKNKIKSLNKKWIIWTIAAAVLISIIFEMWPEKKTRGPSQEYAFLFEEDTFEKTIEHTLYRSVDGPEALADDQIYAYNLYVDQQFNKAIPELSKLWEKQKDSLAYKYLGYSYLGIGLNEKGLKILSNFDDNELLE